MHKLRLVLFTGFLLFAITALDSRAQTGSNEDNKPNASGQTEESAAQRHNAEAQAAYYRELTRNLNRTRTLRQTVVENPGIVAALVGAIIALITLFVNNRNSLRSQRDTQFYEALKRFGDQQSNH